MRNPPWNPLSSPSHTHIFQEMAHTCTLFDDLMKKAHDLFGDVRRNLFKGQSFFWLHEIQKVKIMYIYWAIA